MKKILFSYIMTDLFIDLWSHTSDWLKMILYFGKAVAHQKLVRSPNFSVDKIVMGRGRERMDRCEDTFVKSHSKGGQFCVLEWNVRVRSFLRFFRFYVSLCIGMHARKHVLGYSVRTIIIVLSCLLNLVALVSIEKQNVISSNII